MNLRKIISSAIYVLIILLTTEAILRFLFPLPELQNLNRAAYQVMPADAELMRPLRNQKLSWQSSLDTDAVFVHSLNGYGFRDKEWEIEHAAGKPRILFVGDSYVEGAMVEQDETIPVQFSQALEAPVEVMNAGIIGVGFPSYVQLVKDVVPIFEPDRVVLVLYANDITDRPVAANRPALRPEHTSWYRPRIVDLVSMIAQGEGLPMRFPLGVTPFFPATPNPANPWTTNEKRLLPHVQDKVAEAMKAGTFNYYRTNWLALEEQELQASPAVDLAIQRIAKEVESVGGQLAVVYIPSRHQVTDHYLPYEMAQCQLQCRDIVSLKAEKYNRHARYLKQVCDQYQVPFLDLTENIQSEEARGQHLYWNYDDHMRAEGYRFCGKTIAQWWKTQSTLQ